MGDGIWASVCEGFAENNFNALATVLRASPGQLSILSSSQSLLGCWLQLWSEKLVRYFGSRKRLVLTFVGLQALSLLLIFIATALNAGAYTFMALVLLFVAFGSTGGAIWSSWVSDLLPSRRRGFCFGVRNQRTYPLSALSILAAGFILQSLDHALGPQYGTRVAFCTVFLFGFGAKLLSLRHYKKQLKNSNLSPGLCPRSSIFGCGPSFVRSDQVAIKAVLRSALPFGNMQKSKIAFTPLSGP